MPARVSGQKVLKGLNEEGYEAYFVGGMVRDALLGRSVYDADIATNAAPEVVLTLFDKTFATGLKHGTVTVVMDDQNVEVTTFRLDGEYLDNRHPEEVIYTGSLTDDLARRDFTINAMAQELGGRVIDPFNGKTDLERKIIRAVGEPRKRFEEDALRILRGIRFVAKLGFDIEKETLKAMKECRHLLANLSLERIRKEFEGILSSARYEALALDFIVQNSIFEYIPFFSVLMKFNSLNKIKDVATLFNVVAFELENPEVFLSEFPFTKKEKKTIQTLLAIRGEILDERLILFRFGASVLYQRHLLNCFYHNEEFDFKIPTMVISRRADLATCPSEVIKLAKKDPGPWVGKLFIEIEEAVLLEKIENTRGSILKLIEKRGILHVEED